VPGAPAGATLAGNATSQVRYEEDNRYKKELDTYENHIAMDDVMKKQIQKAIEDVFLRQLRHKYSAYLGLTSRDVLDHLMDRYGQIKPADLVEMGYNTPIPWISPSQLMHTLQELTIASSLPLMAKHRTLPNES
jgi:hypothetical protein